MKKDRNTKQKNRGAIILVVCLFFLWGIAHNLNPILIPHLKKACELSDLESAFIDSAFFLGYFIMAIPAGLLIKRYGYKKGILFGLLLLAIGALLFLPAADSLVFGLFLFALFVIASGLTFLETAANPYMTALGEAHTASFRLNLAQSFNGLAASIAPLIGSAFILSGTTLTPTERQLMTRGELAAYFHSEAAQVTVPYLVMSIIVLLLAFVVWRTPLPEIMEEIQTTDTVNHSVWKEKNLLLGVTAQFFYVGAQVCVSSFFIRFLETTAGIGEKSAALYLSLALLFFMLGRFIGTFLMKFVAAERLLLFYSLANVCLLILAVKAKGMVAVYALMGVQFFMSIMFPTIFYLSIKGLGQKTKLGSSLLIMAIAGGAVLPVVMGKISDRTGIQTAYLIPAVCFIVVLYFSFVTGRRGGSVVAYGPKPLTPHT